MAHTATTTQQKTPRSQPGNRKLTWNPVSWIVYTIQFFIQSPDRVVQNVVQYAALSSGPIALFMFVTGVLGSIVSLHVFLSTDIGLQIQTYQSYDMEILLAFSLAVAINAIQMVTALTMRGSFGVFLIWVLMTIINTLSNMAEIPNLLPSIADNGNAVLFFSFLSASLAQVLVLVFGALSINTAVAAATAIGGFFGFMTNLGNVITHGYKQAQESPDERRRRLTREMTGDRYE